MSTHFLCCKDLLNAIVSRSCRSLLLWLGLSFIFLLHAIIPPVAISQVPIPPSNLTIGGATPTNPPPAVTGNNYYVASNGNDSNVGSLSQPFRTISRAVAVLKPGDTLYIRAGTYAESLYCGSTVCIPGGTSWSSPVTVAAYPGETVIIKPNSGLRVMNFEKPGQNYIIIDRLIIDGSNVGYDGIQIQNAAHHIRIQNSEIKNAPGQGINVGPGSGYHEFIGNSIHDLGKSSLTHGIYITGNHVLVQKNNIWNISGYGVHVYSGYAGVRASNNTVTHNRIHNVGTLKPSNAAGIILSVGENNVAYNNVISGSPIGIKTLYGNPSGSKIYNNTVYQNSIYGIQVGSDSSNAAVKNNILYQNGTNLKLEASAALANNLTTDPKFVNAAGYDFRLQSASPAIDAGVALSEVVDDIIQTRRPQRLAHDIGAYEFFE